MALNWLYANPQPDVVASTLLTDPIIMCWVAPVVWIDVANTSILRPSALPRVASGILSLASNAMAWSASVILKNSPLPGVPPSSLRNDPEAVVSTAEPVDSWPKSESALAPTNPLDIGLVQSIFVPGGGCLVHGIFIVLWTIGSIGATAGASYTETRCGLYICHGLSHSLTISVSDRTRS